MSSAPLLHNRLVEALSSVFVKQYSPAVSLQGAISSILALQGLRAFWPMSAQGTTGNLVDIGGGLRTLTRSGGVGYGVYGLAPYAALNGTTGYFATATESDYDIIGNEAWYESNVTGLTIGGWFYPFAAGASYALMTKGDGSGAGTSYWLDISGGAARFLVGDGAAMQGPSGGSPAANTWTYMVGRYDPSTEVALFRDGTKYTDTTGVPATLLNTATAFNIGTYNNGAGLLFAGRASLCFICSAALPDRLIQSVYHITRALFGL
jgi:hypothetical protein